MLNSAPFSATPGPGNSVGLGSATFHVHPGDDVVVAGDPFAITGPTWTALEAPVVTGTLVLTVNGTDVTLTPSGQPIDITSFLPAITQPTLVTLGLRVDAPAARPRAAASRSWQVRRPQDPSSASATAWPMPSPAAHPAVPHDGARRDTFAATADVWYRLDGGYPNGSVGGAIVDGVPTPKRRQLPQLHRDRREVWVTYSDARFPASSSRRQTAVISLLPATANAAVSASRRSPRRGSRSPRRTRRVCCRSRTSVVADGVNRPVAVDINSVRDNVGTPSRMARSSH